jgi:hypothetical protein
MVFFLRQGYTTLAAGAFMSVKLGIPQKRDFTLPM